MPTLKPTHKAVRRYYEDLEQYDAQGADHEGTVSSAFQRLLDDTSRAFGWILLTKFDDKVTQGRIVPDGTLKDQLGLPRGHWEAKDTHDDLDVEIAKKIKKGYPLLNIIFEDTRQAVLFQNGKEVFRVDLSAPKKLADLLNHFYNFVEPHIEKFDKAVEEFKVRIPDLARGLNDKIKAAHTDNKKFITAFESFFTLCQTSLNPNIRRDAVDEMLIQHLLTERVIRTIFNNPDFIRRNVIAAEIDKVIDALVSKSFNRDDFLRSLDRFYKAIENAAAIITDFNEKQKFLNTVYERFFQGYSVKVADTHGIVYTPPTIVDFMCASVVEVLRTEFGKGISDPDIFIIDPATGTGSFLANLLRRIPKPDLPRMYAEQLFANELMLLPYYIAFLNIEHTYYELTGNYEAFPGLCFVDTLDLVKGQTDLYISEENTERIERERKSPITVIIGNPPYNMGQQNENDNNKNRTYKVIDQRIRETYSKDSQATLKNKLFDPYVKFFRWATDRLEKRDGIICFISNNSFVQKTAFDGMRKHLLKDFTRVYHIDLHGNVKENPRLSGTTHNVFGIQVGVGITVAIRFSQHKDHKLFYFRVPENWRKEEKLSFLEQNKSIAKIEWKSKVPDHHNAWILPEETKLFKSFIPVGTQKAKRSKSSDANVIFRIYSLGIATNRDSQVYDFNRDKLLSKAEKFIEIYNSTVDILKRKAGKATVDSLINVKDSAIKWTWRTKKALSKLHYCKFNKKYMRNSLYRPFSKQYVYFDDFWIERRYKQYIIFPTIESERENKVICLAGIAIEKPFYAIISNKIPNLAFVGFGSGCQCFPFYFYNEDGSHRRENLTDWALKEFREHYQDKTISKWDIFYYVYGLLHHPDYRKTFADNLRRDLPRLPFAPDFRAFSDAGKKLADLHLNYEQIEPYSLQKVCAEKEPLSYRVKDKMRLSKDKSSLVINPSLTLAGIPPETFNYRLGNRSALDWVIDQYQVKKDKRTGIISDPNREEDEQYIVRLVGQVIQVSLETVKFVAALPEKYSTIGLETTPTTV